MSTTFKGRVAVASLSLKSFVDATSAYGALMVAVGISLTFGAYFVLRYLGLWSEQDTAVFMRIITEMQESGSLRSPGAYTHGYAYPLWATTLANMTGLSVSPLLQLYTPLIGNLFLGIFGFAAFRRLLVSDRLGLLAAGFLFLVPELVFTVSRGNHEKLTVSLTLLGLLALLNSYMERRRTGRWAVFAVWVGVLYTTVFTLVSLNIFFGSGFLVASTIILIFTSVVAFIRPRKGALLRAVARRQIVVVAISWLLFLLVTWYVYPQSGTHTDLLDSTVERLQLLFFPNSESVEEDESFTASNPYAVGNSDWSSLSAYRMVSLFRWVLLFGSSLTWLLLFIHAWRKLEDVTLPRLFLLAFYAAFTVQLALAIPIDFLSLAAGTNLQVRMYTYFALLAPPMLALGLASFTSILRPNLLRLLWLEAVGISLLGFILLSFFKATLDPTVSNRWIFYHPAELQAIYFWDQGHENSNLWTDIEGRLRYAYTMTRPWGAGNNNEFHVGAVTPRSVHALRSPLIRDNAIAWRLPMPTYWLENRPYDNGEVQIFYRIPKTPFQP